MPDMVTGNEAWTRAGGTHHSVISYDLTVEHMADFAEIMGIEFGHIGAGTTIDDLKTNSPWATSYGADYARFGMAVLASRQPAGLVSEPFSGEEPQRRLPALPALRTSVYG